uniref:Oleosin n=1 Tax=Leersia perrieri TaxID=77586 RepID=A0A0D9XCH9_9ORYZ
MAGELGHHRGGGPAAGEHYLRMDRGDDDEHNLEKQSAAVSVTKGVIAATAAGSMLALAGLTLTGTVLALIVATPLLVIFSPVLVPAAFAVSLLVAGFASSGAFGAAAVGILAWMYRYLQSPSGENAPVGADKVEHARARLDAKAHDVRDWAQHGLDQART